MNNKKVILINSGNRCGKDTAAELLASRISELGKSVEIYSFASGLKEDVAKLLGMTVEELDLLKNKNETITVGNRTINTRSFIIEYSELVKSLTNKYFYANKGKEFVRNSKAEYIIIPDLRFKEEYEMFNVENTFFITIDSDLEDCSGENYLKDFMFDFTFKNESGSIETLKFDIENFLINEVI
jgi:hypothetical protein